MSSKLIGILHQGLAYAVTTVIACAVGAALLPEQHILVAFLIADLVGTLVIFGFSRLHNNSSLYDPYWSVAPIVIIAGYIALFPETNLRLWGVAALVCVWGNRLTFNFLRGWKGLAHEDWRYVDFRERFPRAYWWVSLGGIHGFPTLLVFLGCLAFYPIATSQAPLGPLDLFAFVVTAGAIAIETIADKQLHNYVARGPDKPELLDEGLWRYSRHPNYFGELSFWWGLWLFGMAAEPLWWTAAGPIAMTCLFFFVSVPLIDKRHLRHRPNYLEHIKKVSAIIPWRRAS